MKQPEAVKLSQEQTKQTVITSGKDVMITLLNSPLMQLATFCAFIELCQMIRPDGEHQLISDYIGSTLQGVAISTQTVQALTGSLSNALPAIGSLLALMPK